MAIPWPILAIGADFLLKKIDPKGYGGQTDIPDIGKMKDELTLTDKDIQDLRKMSLRDIASVNMRNLADIKQLGAARRMPTGAVTSAIQGSGERAAEAVSRVGPGLKLAQKDSRRSFLNSMLPYFNMQAGQNLRGGMSSQATMGALGKIATLWGAGLIDMDGSGGGAGQQNNQIPGQVLPYGQDVNQSPYFRGFQNYG